MTHQERDDLNLDKEDLIDFEVGSPELTQSILAANSQDVPETLIDSELVRLEETLQSASNTPLQRSRCNSKDSVELEQVLITIDDEDEVDEVLTNEGEIKVEGDKPEEKGELQRNYDETLTVLDELDRILSIHDDLEGVPVEDETVEECLRDLDDYLQTFDISGSEECNSYSPELVDEQTDVLQDDEIKERLRRLVARSASLGRNGKLYPGEPKRVKQWGTLARNNRFRATISALRRELRPNLQATSSNQSTYSFPSTEPEVDDKTLVRNHHLRATTGALNFKAPYQESLQKKRISYLNLHESPRKAVSADWKPLVRDSASTKRDRKSEERVDDSDEETNWSWSNERAFASQPEIEVTASPANEGAGDEKEDTSVMVDDKENLIVDRTNISLVRSSSRRNDDQTQEQAQACSIEPQPNKAADEPQIPTSSWLRSSMRRLTSLPPSGHHEQDKPLDNQRPTSSSWLRSSMRRIRHFRLPSDPTPNEPIVTTPVPQAEIQPPVVQQRPFSAPVRINSEVTVNLVQTEVANNAISDDSVGRVPPRSSSESSRSRRARSLSSSESSLASSVDSTPSCTPAVSPTNATGNTATENTTTNNRRQCERPPQQNQMPEATSPLGQWPHSLSSMLATLGCTLGLFNVCRFATLTVHFGANFIIQFLLMSFVFGIPMFTLQLCLGQQLGAGVVDMWRISPLFQGVGVALLISQALLGIYSVVGVSWMFIYFRDSFITKMDQYKWAQTFEYYREDSKSVLNGTTKIEETVPDYLSGVVLQRHNLVTGNSFGAIKFQVAFNLAVVWMIVFVSLSKGLRSYAKVVYVFSLLPIFGTFVLCAKLLGMTPSDSIHEVFPETSWGDFFLNTRSWLAASQEVFLTWGLLGAAVMQLASHNKHRHLLQRDSSFIIILTITILMLTAFLANTCIEILHFYGYNYLPDSFERMSSYIFLRSSKEPLPPSLATTPVRYMTHSSFVLGEKVIRPGMDRNTESGYQVLRFATELVPATLAILGPNQISPFWAVLFYFVLILFGIAQQLAIWHCVITGIMAIKAKVLKSWETTITFFSCTFGFILGLPMTTEMGIYVVYFLDYCVGGMWWLSFVYLMQVVAVFMVRGRPYSGDTVVTALFTSSSSACVLTWLAPLLSFTWNVVLPVALMVICITVFRTGNFRELFVWHHSSNTDYWAIWIRQLGSFIQLIPILCIPVVGLIQSYRYLNNGPPDILDRIQLLYRPPMNSEHLDDTVAQQAAQTNNNATVATVTIPAEDPPPKYTPPPSYTTATGARIAKLLRQSIRRSVRRITSVLGESSLPRTDNSHNLQLPPPDYNAVLVEMNQSSSSQTNDILRSGFESRTSRELSALQGSTLTAADVASILRSSFRRSTIRTLRRNQIVSDEVPSGSLSNQNLVDGVAPLGIDSLFLGDISVNTNDINNENKSVDVNNP